jgi:predicted ATP-grasp superfamily ATP-dependent carboligase
MWLLKTKDKEGRERKIVGNGYNARTIGEVLTQFGFAVKVFRVETYRDAETSRLWCIDPESGRMLWVKSEEDLFIRGYSEVFPDDEFECCETVGEHAGE